MRAGTRILCVCLLVRIRLLLLAVVLLRCGRHTVCNQFRNCEDSAFHRVVHRRQLFLRDVGQHPIRQIIIRMRLGADTDLDARELLRAQHGDDALDAVLVRRQSLSDECAGRRQEVKYHQK